MAIYITAGHSTQRDPWLGIEADPGKVHGPYVEAKMTVELRDLVVKELVGLGLEAKIDDDRASWPAILRWMQVFIKRSDLLLDIHFNAASFLAYGTEVFVADNASKAAKAFAKELSANVAAVLGTADRGVKPPSASARGDLAVPKMSDKAVLIEVCFLTNTEDMRKYDMHKKDVARAIALTIDKHYY